MNRPDLTADKFIPNPFSNVAGARMYQTGDLARTYPTVPSNISGVPTSGEGPRIQNRTRRNRAGARATYFGAGKRSVSAHQDVHGEKRLVAYVVATPSIR